VTSTIGGAQNIVHFRPVVLITSSDPNGPQQTSSGLNNEARYLTIVMVLFNIANKVKFKIKFH